MSVPVLADKTFERQERFDVTLSNPQGSGNPELSDGTGVGTVADDDTEVNTVARDAERQHRIRVIVGTNPDAADDRVTVYRRVRGEDPVLYSRRLNENGWTSRQIRRDFAHGANVRVYAEVLPQPGTGDWYRSETEAVTVRR